MYMFGKIVAQSFLSIFESGSRKRKIADLHKYCHQLSHYNNYEKVNDFAINKMTVKITLINETNRAQRHN